MPYANREKQLEYLREYRRKQREKERENRPPIETKQGSLDKLKREAKEREGEFEEHRAFGSDYFGRRQEISEQILNPEGHSKPIENPTFIRGGENRLGMIPICPIHGVPFNKRGYCDICSGELDG